MTPDDVLLVLNELEPVDLDQFEFCVITAGAKQAPGQGRLAGQIVELDEEQFWPFERAEILVVGKDSGREPFGMGRKPAKHWTTEEYFDTLAEATECRRHVLAGTWDVEARRPKRDAG